MFFEKTIRRAAAMLSAVLITAGSLELTGADMFSAGTAEVPTEPVTEEVTENAAEAAEYVSYQLRDIAGIR